MSAAVAARTREEDHIVIREAAIRIVLRLHFHARLLDAPRDPKRLAVPLQHLGHERQAIKASVGIEGGQYLTRRADNDQVTSVKFRVAHLPGVCGSLLWLVRDEPVRQDKG